MSELFLPRGMLYKLINFLKQTLHSNSQYTDYGETLGFDSVAYLILLQCELIALLCRKKCN